MDLDELEATQGGKSPTTITEWTDPEPDDEQTLIDLREGIHLLSTAKALLDYISNPLLIRTMSKRERDVGIGLSEQIRRYLAEVVPTYEEEA